MKVLLTGENGFIGSTLCLELQNNEKTVVHFKNRIESSPINPELINLQCILHLAYKRFENFEDELNYNLCLLRQCQNVASINRSPIILASSAAVYGPVPSFVKESQVLAPQNQYGKIKALLEDNLLSWSQENNIPVCILRIFNPYGIFPSRHYLISDFINHCLNNSKFEIKYPEDRRDFILIDELATALDLLTNKFLLNKKTEIFNVGLGKAVTVREIIPIIEYHFRTKANVTFGQGNSYLPLSCADISHLSQYLGWAPSKSIYEGIEALALGLGQHSKRCVEISS